MNLAPAPSEPCTEGSIVAGKYRLESLLGEGGMGSVWRAFNVQLDVPVAIKLLRTDLAATDLGERLRVEARAAAKLVHPSIVRVFDIGESGSGDPFIVMELLSGESLGALLERGPLPAVQALQVLLPIAEALSLAHSRGVVHRDIKPDNIFIAREGSVIQPKLLDFGIAKVTSGGVSAGAATLTQTGTLLGSPDYMSPEQAYAEPNVDARSDIWAFCVVLYEMLAGHTPFRGDNVSSVLRSVVQDEPQALDTVASVDPALSSIVRRGLEKDRDARPASIFELGQELACWLFAQGVLEDATGASLEAKWLGRATEDRAAYAPASFAPRAQHEHPTLVSVVRRSQLPNSEPLAIPLQRPGRWLPVTIGASMAALAAAWLWVTLAPVRSDSLATAATLPAITEMQGRAASRPEPQPVSLAATHADPDLDPKAEIKVPPLAKVSTTARAAQAAGVPAARTPPAATVQAVRIPAAPSLPRALPAVTQPAHEKRADLLNPY